jgi:hypothetical protein
MFKKSIQILKKAISSPRICRKKQKERKDYLRDWLALLKLSLRAFTLFSTSSNIWYICSTSLVSISVARGIASLPSPSTVLPGGDGRARGGIASLPSPSTVLPGGTGLREGEEIWGLVDTSGVIGPMLRRCGRGGAIVCARTRSGGAWTVDIVGLRFFASVNELLDGLVIFSYDLFAYATVF